MGALAVTRFLPFWLLVAAVAVLGTVILPLSLVLGVLLIGAAAGCAVLWLAVAWSLRAMRLKAARRRNAARILAAPLLLGWCLSFCVTDMGDRLDVFRGAPHAYEVPIAVYWF